MGKMKRPGLSGLAGISRSSDTSNLRHRGTRVPHGNLSKVADSLMGKTKSSAYNKAKASNTLGIGFGGEAPSAKKAATKVKLPTKKVIKK